MSAANLQDQNTFVLTYESMEDPSMEEVAGVLKQLRPFDARPMFPGAIKITGPRTAVERATEMLNHWRLAPEGRLTHTPPRKVFAK